MTIDLNERIADYARESRENYSDVTPGYLMEDVNAAMSLARAIHKVSVKIAETKRETNFACRDSEIVDTSHTSALLIEVCLDDHFIAPFIRLVEGFVEDLEKKA